MSKIQSLKGSLKGLSSRLKIEYSLFKRLDSVKSYKIHLSFRIRKPQNTANCAGGFWCQTENIYLFEFVMRSNFGCCEQDGIYDYDPAPQLPGIPHGCRSTSPPLSIVDRQQQVSGVYQSAVSVEHTPVIILTAHIVHRIGLAQNRMIPFLC